ncbi:hypothetical protein CHLRE_03g191300v5 [Chlamydomonas reinhardtii]|uniref:Uncharacterized protein n=1 Tax=Chlamydomonas reinhardtii TaxID=3055 RepID=A0A2K3DYF4_CHLRE|nr:uncharacterized protein CHLRE_03g191300v5 [Chlamydomonas reinhardtii]PNW85537.1 hypothetical protein CHLRE_03g191300v5 [Chlamydomonas reinhardtii]
MQLRVSRGHAGRATAKKPTCSVIAYTHRQGAQAMSTTKPVAAPTYNPQALAFAASTVAGALLARAALLANATDLRNALSKLGQLERQAAIGAFHPKSPFATAHAPATAGPFAALPSQWLVVTSAAHWFEQHRLAAESGALLATVFVSDAAARAQGPLLERLRRTYGGEAGPVHFVFVHVGAGYVQRSAAASRSAAAAGLRGRQALADLGRVSNVAALHGLDVALGSFLPNGGLRAVPSMLLSQPSSCESACASVSSSMDLDTAAARCWAAASRAGELRQLVSDWAFINTALARAATVAALAAAAAAAPTAAAETALMAAPMHGAICQSSAGHGTGGMGTASTDANNNIVPFQAASVCACLLPHSRKTA